MDEETYFDGFTYEAWRDFSRLAKQFDRVWALMSDARWRTLAEIRLATGNIDTEAAISARLRDFRKPRFGAHTVNRRDHGAGLFAYRLLRKDRHMGKVTITFEGDSWLDVMTEITRTFSHQPATLSTAPEPIIHNPKDVAPEPPEPKKATRAKPSATKPPPPPEPEPEIEPEEATPIDMPPLEVLKQAVTVAVRAAQKNGGPKKILELLPEFKTETGLDFVMNSTEAHRAALYGLVKAAGLNV
jgi:hypothetical protein